MFFFSLSLVGFLKIPADLPVATKAIANGARLLTVTLLTHRGQLWYHCRAPCFAVKFQNSNLHGYRHVVFAKQFATLLTKEMIPEVENASRILSGQQSTKIYRYMKRWFNPSKNVKNVRIAVPIF